MTSTAVRKVGPVKATAPSTVGDHLRNYVSRVRGGDIGALPAVLGLLVLCTVFSVMRPSFLSAVNFANLFTQGAAVTLIAMGLVFVLLLGEIDLSAGFASGVCAAVLANIVTVAGYPWYVAVLAAILTGLVIGLALGFLVAKVGIPSFVVTLAAFLAFQGIVLLLISGGSNISVRDKVLVAIANRNLPPVLGWLFFAVVVGGYAATQLLRHRKRIRRGLVTDPFPVVLARIGGLAVILGVAVYILNLERSRNVLISSLKGVPIVVPIIAALLVLWTFVLQRTAYGRHVYAVGGNQEAARRAGINVDRIRISVFVICSTMAAIGGIVAASRANSVDPNTGGSNVLLYAVGAAVIGGTSLFGGKGRVLDAVLGGAVVAVIDNGMGLMGYSSGVKYVVTGVVLLLAASVDAFSRRRAAATGTR
ncbi:sugar ABC transporter permease [Micromonospora sagamiensis]|uniref:Xylose transport system permease protein XylH n=1 Tax=Micromonospora sagamiensis TaxID=47875 RepID=A0A562WAC9_9ACTN|nr:ABC transporter permease [Micromonospora sagamiensis]TWJ27156.1 D-xylose transport system permease protein [Micromonospora sagamiensis]BCL13949.1 ABC transporter permease [Micromonospora sagamiensis]